MMIEHFIIIALLGLAVGSFLNVLIYRIPQGESVSFPASHCPQCQTPLKAWHNIPFFSWLLLGGRCAFCKKRISFQYPLVELLTALIFVIVFAKLGWRVESLFLSLSFIFLLALSIIDWRYKSVPDSLNLLALIFAIAFSPFTGFHDAIIFAGGFTLLRFAISYYLFKKFSFLERRRKPASWRKNYNIFPSFEAMGEADIMVAASMGAILGLQVGLFAIFLSALLTLPVALFRLSTDKQTPFVPFLAAGLFISFLFYSHIQQWLGSLHV